MRQNESEGDRVRGRGGEGYEESRLANHWKVKWAAGSLGIGYLENGTLGNH